MSESKKNEDHEATKEKHAKNYMIAEDVVMKDVSDKIDLCGNSDAGRSAADSSSNNKVEEIINIDDEGDDDNCDPEEKLKRSKCVNINCKSGDDLQPCEAMFVFQYFGMKRTKDQLVCAQCFDMALKHQENLAGLLEQHIPLFEAHFPDRNAVVVLDSDEEEDESCDKELLPTDVRLMIENDIEELLQKGLYEFDIDYQIKENVRMTEDKVAQLEEIRKELDKTFDDSLKLADEFYKKMYKDFEVPIKELEPLIIGNSPPTSPMSQYHRPFANRSFQRDSSNRRPTAVAMKKVTQVNRPASFQQDQVSLDIVEVVSNYVKAPPLPPMGAVERPKLEIGNSVYVMRISFFTSWVHARIIEIIHNKTSENNISDVLYKVKIESSYRKSSNVKSVAGRYLAYPKPSPVRLPVGSRVIAIFREEGQASNKDNYYSGIIAEPPKTSNKYRYLVFFDDGYAQYVPHDNILLVCECSRNVWEDVHPESQEFIKNYLQQYPERPMVKLNLDEVVRTEWNGKWWVARVKEIDGSLVKMYFDADERTEWIYRGSTRLGPLYVEMLAAKDRLESGGRHRYVSIKRRNMPYVEYTRNAEFEEKGDEDELVKAPESVPSRSVARKSTNRRPGTGSGQDHLGPVDASERPKPYIEQQHPGYFVKVSLADAIKPRFFRPHQCNDTCVSWTRYSLSNAKGMNSLLRPLKFGFQRLFCNKRGKQPLVLYLAPCGRRLRNHEEVHMYLRNTKSELTVDLFEFDPWVSCVLEYRLETDRTIASIKDLSYDKENVPISCVNYVDSTLPDFVYYMTERKAMDGVNLNLDPNFLSGCDCTDGCADRKKCACWRLTIGGVRSIPGYSFDESTIGYQYRRLADRVVSGIYECNPQCKCSHTCLNRVAQQPLSVKLQLYKTLMKGWGIRCLHDVPQGSFICIYAGNLLTEQAANEGGKNYGDEYLAELDYIEVVENLKEDYESGVIDDYDENSKDKGREKDNSDDSDDGNDEYHDDGDESCSSNEFEVDNDSSQDGSNVNADKRRNRYETDREYKYAMRRQSSVSTSSDSSSIRTRLRTRESDKDKEKSKKTTDSEKKNISKDNNVLCISDDDEEVREPSRFAANINDSDRGRSGKSVRDFYGDDECIYVMDAKNSGNIGRYLNHSCNPNIFVQNVFVDTHDLRFPWVAFFASQFIKAGDELTWDYNYDVGSVPGKVLHCYCGENNCRRRLL